MGNPLIFGEIDFTIGFAALMFPIQCTMGDFFFEKPHFTMENFKFWEAGGGIVIFGP